MIPLQVVIDTNVLVAAWRSRNGASFQLISSFIAGDDQWQWNVSTAMLLEYEEVLKRQDDFLLDLAVASGSGIIVTFNTRNFLAARAFGIRVLAPKRFLDILTRQA